MNQQIQQQIAQAQIQNALVSMEKALDDQIKEADEEMEKIQEDEDEYERLRRKRLKEMREEHEKKTKWQFLGHGQMQELNDAQQFFGAVKQSERVVAFFSNGSKWCNYLEGHLSKIAQKHPETRFIKVNADKAAPLVEHLQIWMMPTVTLIRQGETDHSIVGLDEVGGQEMTVVTVARALSQHNMIEVKRIQ
uniref:Thioredoxin domain-containing protein n=1 Tax=Percolomonas cosmopolitus TaxID=63605 RepID=A0A6U0L629_9EUKA|mmetsp:Transcript_6302/g.23737  ORF Transcript_6302/g.23737 Transcript_6302/m.23737 type:complete len:192 (+) Transcript_6302:168-743(+)|eukprot:CAMPEP_0117435924 /NCGR_PEP_ID=MMETSP0759-20121206/739_1 /TAXON_ID=63605 /ORGANISM="Percolomonas cosmopolitus, Strain WS" /LENGTH=191 /DNA_ID=CAMNT_0005227501 /DNA_START=307 /DNA_END=882 /DNA_ORIENTATION=-